MATPSQGVPTSLGTNPSKINYVHSQTPVSIHTLLSASTRLCLHPHTFSCIRTPLCASARLCMQPHTLVSKHAFFCKATCTPRTAITLWTTNSSDARQSCVCVCWVSSVGCVKMSPEERTALEAEVNKRKRILEEKREALKQLNARLGIQTTV